MFFKPSLALLAIALTVVPGLKTRVQAKGFGGVPECAQPALLSAVQAAGCQPTDTACICTKGAVFDTVQESIQSACSKPDQAAVEALAKAYCGSVQPVSSSIKTATATTTASSTEETVTTKVTKTSDSTSQGPVYPSGTETNPVRHPEMTHNAAVEVGLSAGALAVAVGVMGWVFVEL
jgi:hypothetical protein